MSGRRKAEAVTGPPRHGGCRSLPSDSVKHSGLIAMALGRLVTEESTTLNTGVHQQGASRRSSIDHPGLAGMAIHTVN